MLRSTTGGASDPIFSKPYEPGTAPADATAGPAATSSGPTQRRVRPIGALLGGLRPKS